VQRVAIAGSTRRWSETVGDLDLLATTSGEPRRIMESFVELEAVGEVLSNGPTKTTVRLRNGMRCDLRVVDDGFWGSALHHFTGSKFHHIELRALAKERGLKISEYGVVDAVTEEFLAGAEEVDVYAALGLPLIPPELREGHGEVSAALAGQLPELVTGKDIRGDLHMHTTASDGTASIEEMARACREKGHEYICISDHSQAVTIANGLTPQRLLPTLRTFGESTRRSTGSACLRDARSIFCATEPWTSRTTCWRPSILWSPAFIRDSTCLPRK